MLNGRSKRPCMRALVVTPNYMIREGEVTGCRMAHATVGWAASVPRTGRSKAASRGCKVTTPGTAALVQDLELATVVVGDGAGRREDPGFGPRRPARRDRSCAARRASNPDRQPCRNYQPEPNLPRYESADGRGKDGLDDDVRPRADRSQEVVELLTGAILGHLGDEVGGGGRWRSPSRAGGRSGPRLF